LEINGQITSKWISCNKADVENDIILERVSFDEFTNKKGSKVIIGVMKTVIM